MSTRHLLDTEGAVVCGASARDDGGNVTRILSLVSCDACMSPLSNAPSPPAEQRSLLQAAQDSGHLIIHHVK